MFILPKMGSRKRGMVRKKKKKGRGTAQFKRHSGIHILLYFQLSGPKPGVQRKWYQTILENPV